MKRLFFLLISIMTVLTGVCADEHEMCIVAISGIAEVKDGDTISINEYKIRLSHVDSPELKQQCEDKSTHLDYNCGIEARDFLQELIKNQEVTCYKEKIDIYRRILAECFAGDININQYMVSSGHAVLYRTDKTYKEEQSEAKLEERGVWHSYFELPWIWRKEQQLKTKFNKNAH
jgi:endonuclease YncB( thermonuclease family)